MSLAGVITWGGLRGQDTGGTVLHVALHGLSDRNRFVEDCRLHEHVPTAYPKAPTKRGWRDDDAEELVAGLLANWPAWSEGLHLQTIHMMGHSLGAQMAHGYAVECIRAGLPVVKLLHYAGWAPDYKAPIPCVCVVNRREVIVSQRWWYWTRILRKDVNGVRRTAELYGVDMVELGTGRKAEDAYRHRWLAGENRRILQLMQAA